MVASDRAVSVRQGQSCQAVESNARSMVLTLTAGSFSTWHRAGSAGSPGIGPAARRVSRGDVRILAVVGVIRVPGGGA